MKQFIQSILVAAIFLIGLNHSVSSENSQRVYAVDLEAYLSAAGYKVGKFEGEWEKEDGTRLLFLKKALKKYVLKKYIQDNSFPRDTKITTELFATIRASLGDKAPPLKGKGENSPYFIKGVLSNSWAAPPPPSRKSVNEKLKARKTINVFNAWNNSLPVDGYGLRWSKERSKRHKSIDDASSEDDRFNKIFLLEVHWYANLIKKITPG